MVPEERAMGRILNFCCTATILLPQAFGALKNVEVSRAVAGGRKGPDRANEQYDGDGDAAIATKV